ncbi:MAG: tRNA (adenosine(37)-N6)-threonylcarbamoyltransferase complex dimerization subunit type 1 TsaB [Clostridia bacterium]|nr:tRNA (adenosine(37)-N6)-threonylcarbamoyltransferase complex dimerization subunit type 1 TsaB [Clostridia bacterium]
MLMLALSTSGPIASACLLRDGVLQSFLQNEGGGTHSETIMPLIDRVLTSAGLAPRDIDLFAADVGPGSFTGVRIGVCASNAMAAANAKPVIGVSSLASLAYGRKGRACALLDARNGNGYAALFEDGMCTLPPSAVVIEDFLSTVPAGTLFVGEGAVLHATRIQSRIPDSRVEEAALLADAVGKAAWESYQNGMAERELLPLYLRPTQAERLYKER